MNWINIKDELPDEGREVMTIDDADGYRNETSLTRQGHLWFFSDISIHVYYRLTHWAYMPEETDHER